MIDVVVIGTVVIRVIAFQTTARAFAASMRLTRRSRSPQHSF
ncbi:hypothetical protein DDI_3723 [Dickeya dianthicola RNS04.9]|nr:hypothetical protein DDI_3723 [Dickeya dianthicola RNS04.9]